MVAVFLEVVVQPHAILPRQRLPRQGIGERGPAHAVRGEGQAVEVHGVGIG